MDGADRCSPRSGVRPRRIKKRSSAGGGGVASFPTLCSVFPYPSAKMRSSALALGATLFRSRENTGFCSAVFRSSGGGSLERRTALLMLASESIMSHKPVVIGSRRWRHQPWDGSDLYSDRVTNLHYIESIRADDLSSFGSVGLL